jgi:HK97 family phage prohead protease
MTAVDVDRLRLPIEYRSLAGELTVRHPDRVIEVLAVPYELEAVVEHHGRMVRETIGRHAFAGAVAKPRKRAVNRDHDMTRIVGVVTALRDRPHGLEADLRISRTPAGDETLDLADDGILDASIGFAPLPGHEHWTADRRSRRITNAYLDHIAMTPVPAYETAKVLAVRAAGVELEQAPTPNLDRIRLAQLASRYGYALTDQS